MDDHSNKDVDLTTSVSSLEGRPKIAYFSMEIGIDESIPTYSGGLGILAGTLLNHALISISL